MEMRGQEDVEVEVEARLRSSWERNSAHGGRVEKWGIRWKPSLITGGMEMDGQETELDDCSGVSVDRSGDEPMVVFPTEAYQKMEDIYHFATVAGFYGGRSSTSMDYRDGSASSSQQKEVKRARETDYKKYNIRGMKEEKDYTDGKGEGSKTESTESRLSDPFFSLTNMIGNSANDQAGPSRFRFIVGSKDSVLVKENDGDMSKQRRPKQASAITGRQGETAEDWQRGTRKSTRFASKEKKGQPPDKIFNLKEAFAHSCNGSKKRKKVNDNMHSAIMDLPQDEGNARNENDMVLVREGTASEECWAMVKTEVVSIVCKFFFSSGKMVRSINETMIWLIPKKVNSKKLEDFILISLCNIVYKIIAKVIVNRMRGILSSIINVNQAAFSKGRHIYDNVMWVNETINSKEFWDKGDCCLKLDLMKAYDRGRMGEKFDGRHGLRQCDLLSPYLFLIVMEMFNRRLIKETISKNMIVPKIRRVRPNGCAMLFADDVIMVVKATKRTIATIKVFLQDFESLAGMKVNKHKSEIYVRTMVDFHMWEIQSILHWSNGSIPSEYLGLPLFLGNLTKNICFPLNKVEKSISQQTRTNQGSPSFALAMQLGVSPANIRLRDTEDILVWSDDGKESFKACEIFNKCRRHGVKEWWRRKIWVSYVLAKSCWHSYIACEGRLPTLDRLQKSRIHLANRCSFCHWIEETNVYVLINCKVAKEVWRYIAAKFDIVKFFQGAIVEAFKRWVQARIKEKWRRSVLENDFFNCSCRAARVKLSTRDNWYQSPRFCSIWGSDWIVGVELHADDLVEKDIQRSLIEEEVLASQYNLRSAKGESFGQMKDEVKVLRGQMADLVAIHQSLTDTVTALQTEFKELQRKLRTYFMPPNATCHAYRMVGELKHTRSLRDYVRAYQRLMLDVPDMQEQDKLNWFILGLQSLAQSEEERSNPETLEDAYVVAERLTDTQHKSYTNAFKPSKKPDHGGNKDDRRERRDEPSTQRQVTFFRKNDNSQNRVVKCWFCDGSHLARQCPKRLEEILRHKTNYLGEPKKYQVKWIGKHNPTWEYAFRMKQRYPLEVKAYHDTAGAEDGA
ncbi:LINE-1 retrotransposable element ORF2 protein [Nymphaea thermarum]|nr:LINE-1 retrotransposable element ORF2 protein [Nymphaea thermarum]